MKIKIKTGYPTSSKTLGANWTLAPKLISNKNAALIVAIFIGIVMTEILGLMFSDIGFEFYKQLYILLLIIPVHELLHIIFFPSNAETKVWIYPKRLYISVTSDGEFSKIRLIISLLAPFIILTLFPLIFCIWFESKVLIYILLYNALASGGDILSFITVVSSNWKLFIIEGDKLYAQIKT